MQFVVGYWCVLVCMVDDEVASVIFHSFLDWIDFRHSFVSATLVTLRYAHSMMRLNEKER